MTQSLIDRPWKRILWVGVLCLLAYLPAALQLTYYRDDWYYAYDAMVGPAGVFRFMFAEDRPARGPFFELYHALFGIAPTPYHLAMLFWRMAGGAAVVWLMHLLWPRRHAAGLVAGALFALYPGFTWWVQGIEYQPMVASAALMVASLCLTVLALRVRGTWTRVMCIAGAVLTGWIYLALVEYAAGMEIFRLALIYFAIDDAALRAWRSRLVAALRAWLPYVIIPVSFTLWRFAYFASERKATDLGAQLSGLFSDPLSTILHWKMSFLLSFINVTLAAWVQPLQNSFFSLRLREQIPALGFALAAGALIWWLLRPSDAAVTRRPQLGDGNWQLVAIWLGLAALVLGILPVVVANRVITFPNFSHYALPASLGVAFLVVGLVELLANRGAQIAAHVGLIALSVLTLQGIGGSALREERIIANFWHQMAWRAPSIEKGTTLLVFYPDVDYGADTDVVWGPANMIYYPTPQSELPILPPLAAATIEGETLDAVYAGRKAESSTYRSHTLTLDYDRILVVTQSASDACVRILDYRWPTLSTGDAAAARLLSASLDPDFYVGSSGAGPALPLGLFGPEPAHSWCYYFEQASLAAQQADWERVVALQAEVTTLGLQPNDEIEWIPFLQAQAYVGDRDAVKAIATRLNAEKLYRIEACLTLYSMAGRGRGFYPQALGYSTELLCGFQP